MIYAAFALWLFLILFAGIGVYRLWGRIVKPGWVNWALLPGTLVSEMAYIFGCLITGGEIRRAKLIGSSGKGAAAGKDNAETPTEAAPRLKVIGPIVAALVAIVACAACILAVHAILGEPVMDRFDAVAAPRALPRELPTSWDGFWGQVQSQVDLIRRAGETFAELDWLDWRVPVFVYLAICLSIRLAPVRRPMGPTLTAVVFIVVVIAVIGSLSVRFGRLVEQLWPLLTYVWANVIFLLTVTLILSGIVALVRNLSGKKPT